MSNLTNVQGALLDSIIRQTNELIAALDENRIYEADRLYSSRSKNLSILSDIKTPDITKLKNYPAFIASLHTFDNKYSIA